MALKGILRKSLKCFSPSLKILQKIYSGIIYNALNIFTPQLLSCTACNKTTLPLIYNKHPC